MAVKLNSPGWDLQRTATTRGREAAMPGLPPEFLTHAIGTEEFVAIPKPAVRGAGTRASRPPVCRPPVAGPRRGPDPGHPRHHRRVIAGRSRRARPAPPVWCADLSRARATTEPHPRRAGRSAIHRAHSAGPEGAPISRPAAAWSARPSRPSSSRSPGPRSTPPRGLCCRSSRWPSRRAVWKSQGTAGRLAQGHEGGARKRPTRRRQAVFHRAVAAARSTARSRTPPARSLRWRNRTSSRKWRRSTAIASSRSITSRSAARRKRTSGCC